MEFGSESSFMSAGRFSRYCAAGSPKLSEPGVQFPKKKRGENAIWSNCIGCSRRETEGQKITGICWRQWVWGGSWMFPAEADKQANNCAGKVCPMELENWVQTSHSKPGSATGSHPIQREGGWTGGRGHIGDRASQLGGPVDWLEGPVDFLIIFCTIQFSRRWMKR